MKKYFIRYFLEFIVIVMGISTSFWFDNYQTNIDNSKKESEVYLNLRTELELISLMIKKRDEAFKFDSGIVENLINDSKDMTYSYTDLIIAVTDWRGFSPSEEIYTSLKYDGGLKYIKSTQIKAAIESFYGSKSSITANMEDESIVQREILKYLHYNHPKILLIQNDDALNDNDKINIFKKVLNKNLTFKSLLKAKHSFMKSKNKGLDYYTESHDLLLSLINKKL